MRVGKKKIDKLLGEILIERGIVSFDNVQEALRVQQEKGGLIGEIIIELGFAGEEDIAQCVAYQYGFPFLPLDNYDISPEVLVLVPLQLCEKYGLIPLDKIGDTCTIAMSNPLIAEAIEEIERLTSLDVQIFVSTISDVRKALRRHYRNDERA